MIRNSSVSVCISVRPAVPDEAKGVVWECRTCGVSKGEYKLSSWIRYALKQVQGTHHERILWYQGVSFGRGLRFFIILFLFNTALKPATWTISNGGQESDSNYIAVYNEAATTNTTYGTTQKSTLVGGYKDPNSDNGHCASGTVASGKSITIIIPESLGKFGEVVSGCQATANKSGGKITSYNFAPKCTGFTLCDAVVQDLIQVPVQGKQKVLRVSPLCQKLGAAIIDNFSDPKSTAYKISEYADCDDSGISYCAIQFIPKNKDWRLRINTDYLIYAGHALPGSCSIGSADAKSKETEKISKGIQVAGKLGSQSSCNLITKNTKNENQTWEFHIPKDLNTQGSVQNTINYWVNNSYIGQDNPPSPPIGYFNYSGLSKSERSQLYDSAYTHYKSDKQTMINEILSQYNFPPSPPYSPPPPPVIQKMLMKRYNSFKKSSTYISDHTKAQNTVDKQIAKKSKESELAGIPCVGTAMNDENGDPRIIYTCSTSSANYKPKYTCKFVYSVNNPGCASPNSSNPCTMQLVSAYCDFPPEIVLQSPDLGDDNFYCGFCSTAEVYPVGLNKVSVPIEDGGYGDEGELYPFKTDHMKNGPNCGIGFASDLG